MLPAVHAQEGTVIGLGEEAHGYASLNARKAGVLLELATEAPITAIVVESSFAGSIGAQLASEGLVPAMKAFLYPYWLTDTVTHAFEQVLHRSGTPEGAFLWGCDVQEDCRFRATTRALMAYPPLGARHRELARCDSVLDRYIGTAATGRPMSAADQAFVQATYASIIAGLPDDERHVLVARALQNRIRLCDLLALADVHDRMALRDSLMAANVLWIREQCGAGGRILLWAADRHVLRGDPSKRPRWCGEHLARALGEGYQVIAVGHRRKRGRQADRWERVPHAVPVAPEAWRTPCP